MSKEYTKDEVKDRFLSLVEDYCIYWNRGSRTKEEALKGLAFSIMVILDGGTSLPGFSIIPTPHKSDQAFHIDNDEDYYPYFESESEYCDIAGDLHDNIFNDRSGMVK